MRSPSCLCALPRVSAGQRGLLFHVKRVRPLSARSLTEQSNRPTPPPSQTEIELSVGRLNCCWPSPAQSFVASVSSRSMTKILFCPKHVCVSKWGPLFDDGGASLSVQALRLLHRSFSTSCHGVQATTVPVHPLSLHRIKQHLCKVYRDFLLMQACAASYALTYATNLNLQLVS
jgi:hypothetical protein